MRGWTEESDDSADRSRRIRTVDLEAAIYDVCECWKRDCLEQM